MPDKLIVKVQRPIASTDPERHWLLYDAHRLREAMIPEQNVCQDLKEAMGEEFKIYIYADYNNRTKTFGFLGVAPNQPW